jgi:hypothetical protein
MTMITHPHGRQMPQGRGVGAVDGFRAASHVAMIKRFAKFTLSAALVAIVVTAIMAIRVVAWFPPFHH